MNLASTGKYMLNGAISDYEVPVLLILIKFIPNSKANDDT
jgi:hypothetical protein